jgi:hypothetical protein
MSETKMQPTEHEPAEPAPHDSHPSGTAGKLAVTPVTAMSLVIVALLVVLLVMKFKTPTDGQKLAPLRAEIEELKRRSGALGMPTLGGGEQLEDIANRMKKDADSMVLLAGRYKQLIDDGNAEVLKKNADLLRSEQYRQVLSNDYDRLKTDLQQAKSSGYEADSLRREIDTLKTQREAQSSEMAALKQQLAVAGEQAPKADLDNLQRRLEETLRAKEFFESRTKELESELGKARQP